MPGLGNGPPPLSYLMGQFFFLNLYLLPLYQKSADPDP